MRRTRRSIVLVAVSLAALGAAASAATAASLTIRPGGGTFWTSSGSVTFSAGSTSVRCLMTLTAEYKTSTISKFAGAEIGLIQNVSWGLCEGGEISQVLFLPWWLDYESIAGTLPEGVTSMGIQIESFRIRFSTFGGFANCLYRGNVALSMALTRISGAQYRSGNIATSSNRLSIIEGFGCPFEASMSGTFFATAQTITRT